MTQLQFEALTSITCRLHLVSMLFLQKWEDLWILKFAENHQAAISESYKVYSRTVGLASSKGYELCACDYLSSSAMANTKSGPEHCNMSWNLCMGSSQDVLPETCKSLLAGGSRQKHVKYIDSPVLGKTSSAHHNLLEKCRAGGEDHNIRPI